MPPGRGIHPRVTEQKLREVADVYLVEKSVQRTKQKLKVHYRTVVRALAAFGIPQFPQSEVLSGERNPSWRGGRILVGRYWHLLRRDHPNATRNGYVAEHRLVMEEKLGRLLLPEEVVHHIDGDPQNNDPSNLQLFASNGVHLAFELKGRTPKRSEDGMRRVREGGRRGALSPRRNRRPRNDGDASQSETPPTQTSS